MNIEKIFEYTSEQMKLEWEKTRESLSQAGNKGGSLENIFHKFMKNYLPETLEIAKGEIIDSDGNHSKQLDTIIFDKSKTIKLYGDKEIRVIPVECVYFVIEVKANINSRETIEQILENMLSVKDLKKEAYSTPKTNAVITTVNLYGKDWSIWPINYFVFSIDSMELKTLHTILDDLHKEKKLPIEKRIDTICTLNKGMITNFLDDGTFDALPQPNSKLVSINTQKSLLMFYGMLSRYIHDTYMPTFNFKKYFKNIPLGTINHITD